MCLIAMKKNYGLIKQKQIISEEVKIVDLLERDRNSKMFKSFKKESIWFTKGNQ